MATVAYCGKLAVGDKGSGHRPIILAIDWCQKVKAFGHGIKQILACVGPDGTRVYKHASAANHMEDGWTLMYYAPDISAKVCAWNPVQGERLAVGTLSDDCHSGTVWMLDYDKKTSQLKGETHFKRSNVYHAHTANSEISSLSWDSNGRFLLVCDHESPSVTCMKWYYDRSKGEWKWWRDFYPLVKKGANEPQRITGLFHPFLQLFVVWGPNTIIWGFTMIKTQFIQGSERLYVTGSKNHWENTFIGQSQGNISFSFNETGSKLATIRPSDNTIKIFTLSVTPNSRSLSLIEELNCGDQPHIRSLGWTKYNILATGGHEQSLHFYGPKENESYADSWVHQCDNANIRHVADFSQVNCIRWQSQKGLHFQLGSAGNDGFIFLWSYDTVRAAARYDNYIERQRDFLEEKLYYKEPLRHGQVKDLLKEFDNTNDMFRNKFQMIADEVEAKEGQMHSLVNVAKALLKRLTEGEEVPREEIRNCLEQIVTLGSTKP